MENMDLVIRGGLLVDERRVRLLDLGIRAGRVAAIGRDLQGTETLDVPGCYVFPGLVDPHVHLSLHVGDLVSADDFCSGTVAAACTAEMPEPLRAGGRWLALAGVGALAALTFVPRLEPWLQRGLAVLPLPEHWRCRLRGTVEQFLLGMRAFQRPPRALGFGGLTVAIWLTDALGAAVIARALGLSLGLLQALLLLAALGLASALPSMPGYVGVYPVVAVALLPTCGFSRSEALAYVLVMQALNYAVVSVYGLWGMWQLR